MEQPQLIAIGHIIKEVIRFPEKEIGPVLGSPAAYSAVTASRLGAKTGVVTRIGMDMPAALLQPLRDAGIDTRGIKIDGEDSRTTVLMYDAAGNKRILYEKVAPPIQFEDVPPAYLAAKAALICPMDYEVPLATMQRLAQRGLLLMADLGGFGGTVATVHPLSGKAEDHAFLKELVQYCSVIKASLEDCQYLFGPLQDAGIAGRFLLELGAQTAIITLGGDGSQVFTGEEKLVIPPFPARVIDTTGAGDAFCGAFLVEYLRSRDLRQAARFASAAASLMIEETGGVLARRMPTTEQVQARLAQAYN